MFPRAYCCRNEWTSSMEQKSFGYIREKEPCRLHAEKASLKTSILSIFSLLHKQMDLSLSPASAVSYLLKYIVLVPLGTSTFARL